MYPSISPALVVRSSTGVTLELPVRADIADALFMALRGATMGVEVFRLGDLCAQDLFGLLRVLDDDDARPPTTSQIKFGLDISRRLGLDLPVGALKDRGIMGRFLTRYADAIRKPLGGGGTPGSLAEPPKKKKHKGSTTIPRSRRRTEPKRSSSAE